MSTALWGAAEVAEYLGIKRTSAASWLRRNQIPVAGYSDPHQGGVSYLYRPDDVRAAAAATPGSGNRTPRRERGN